MYHSRYKVWKANKHYKISFSVLKCTIPRLNNQKPLRPTLILGQRLEFYKLETFNQTYHLFSNPNKSVARCSIFTMATFALQWESRSWEGAELFGLYLFQANTETMSALQSQ